MPGTPSRPLSKKKKAELAAVARAAKKRKSSNDDDDDDDGEEEETNVVEATVIDGDAPLLYCRGAYRNYVRTTST
jgi:hypothetical protein